MNDNTRRPTAAPGPAQTPPAPQSQLDTLKAMAAILRPDWPPLRVHTVLIDALSIPRAPASLATAIAHIATKPASIPEDILGAPWWAILRLDLDTPSIPTQPRQPAEPTPVGPGPGVPRCPEHEYEAAHACRCCRADALANEKGVRPPRS